MLPIETRYNMFGYKTKKALAVLLFM